MIAQRRILKKDGPLEESAMCRNMEALISRLVHWLGAPKKSAVIYYCFAQSLTKNCSEISIIRVRDWGGC